MKSVLVPIANGSEEIEAVTIIDTLRRAGANVWVASVESETSVKASRGVMLTADALINDIKEMSWDLIAIPGGMPGAEAIGGSDTLIQLAQKQIKSAQFCAAICAAPAVTLGRNNLIKDYEATCYPSFQKELSEQCAKLSSKRVCVDRNLITSQGPGTALAFSLKLVELLYGAEESQLIGDTMLSI